MSLDRTGNTTGWRVGLLLPTPGPLFLCLLVAGAGCRQEIPTSLLLTVTSGADAPPPDTVRLRTFDEGGLAYDFISFPAPPPAADSRLGTVVIYPQPVGSLALRVQAEGLRQDAVVSRGTVRALLIPGQQSAAQVALREASQIPDQDRDGVPDEIDNCPSIANPEQRDQNGDGVGDDCEATGDGGATDGPPVIEPEGRPAGAPCTASSECAPGFCVDSVCCESICMDACRSCNLPEMAGQCAPVPAGLPDPRAGCADQGVGSCGFDGMCNGAGGCRRYPAGTVCQPATCADTGERVLPAMCDGNGVCVGPRTQPCAPYACADGECKMSCTSADDCFGGVACTMGSCGKKPLGAPCAGAAECHSGQCVDGICCDTADCSGPCQSCNVPGAAGSCQNLPANADPRAGGCPAQSVESCGRTGKCDGAGGCQLFAAATPCGTRACTDGIETLVPTCNGTGTCVPGQSHSCGLYACSGDACATGCMSDAECSSTGQCSGQRTCRPREANGAACKEARECLSGFCVDGRCCQTMSCPAGTTCLGPGGTCSAP
jgi:hypothetical protein